MAFVILYQGCDWMILKKLKIEGFKSFAKPVIINFESPITAIVGPNGSGKSNIVDAVRWVLGEQSAKTLRGSRMADVIFAGSDGHHPLNKASVTLYLDNSDHFLPLDASQVKICRRVTEDGQSDYLINGSVCRLKDIEELLMDTGLGKDSYSIVGQGKIDSILNSKPEKLRELFEEAAGISKHKMRKSEAEKRLDKTNQDLQRVKDLIWELEKQVKPLKKAAEKAKKYKRLQDELRILEVNLLMDRWEKYTSDLKIHIKDKSFLENKIIDLESNLKGINSEIEGVENSLKEGQFKLEQLQNDYYQTKAKREEVDNNLKILEERKKGLNREKIDLNKQLSELTGQKKVLEKRAEQNETKIREIMDQKVELEKRLKEKERHLKDKEFLLSNSKEKLNYLRDRVLNENSDIKDVNTDLEKNKEKVRFLQNNIDKLVDKRRIIMARLDENQKLKNDLLLESKYIEDNLNNIKEEFSKLKTQERNLQNKLVDFNNKFEEIKGNLSEKRSKLNILLSMEEEFDGYYQGVKNILKSSKRFPGLIGAVADLFSVDKKYEDAIETALGSRIQNVVVNTDSTAKEAIKYLKSNKGGRATFLPLNMIQGRPIDPDKLGISNMKGFMGLASEFVIYDDNLQSLADYLLGRIIIASNLDTATEIAKETKSRFKIVTLSGDLINPGGAITGGSVNKKRSILGRSREIDELKSSIDLLTSQIESLKDEGRRINKDLKDSIVLQEEKRDEIHQLELKKSEIEKDLSNLNNEGSNFEEQLAEIEKDITDMNKQREDSRLKIMELEKRLDHINNEFSGEKAEINQRENKLAELENEKEKIKVVITNLKVNIATVRQNRDNLIKEADNIEVQLIGIKEKIKDTNERIHKLYKEQEHIKNRENNMYSMKEDLEVKTKELKTDYEEKNSCVKKKQKQLDDLRDKQLNLQNELNKFKEQNHKLDLKITRLEDRKNQIWDRLIDEYEYDPEKNKNYIEKIDIKDYKKVDKKVKELKSSIRNLGTVNQGAIQEYSDLMSRIEYLKNQHNDLQKAKDSIIRVIQEIEDNMSELFAKTFYKVKDEFSSIFRDLFGGGKAELKLTIPDDLLETGVEIIAQPPGKQLKKITLMSGGERALTAIALVFAFLKVNPSPFYILDEIDAPLDDANVVRFARFIKRFSSEVQFVLITHRKGMMAEVETIYGITMEESGISKIISLKLNEEIA